MTEDMPVIDMYFHHKGPVLTQWSYEHFRRLHHDRRRATGRREKGLDIARAA